MERSEWQKLTIGGIFISVILVVIVIALIIAAVPTCGCSRGPSAVLELDFSPSPAGLIMEIESLDTAVTVQLNGKTIASVAKNSTGKEILIPTSLGDEIYIATDDRSRALLATKTIDNRSETGDFIAHYKFDSSSGRTVTDYANNGNSMNVTDPNATWTNESLNFDASTNHSPVANATLSSPEPVTELTVVVSFSVDALPSSTTAANATVLEYGSAGIELAPTTKGGEFSNDYGVQFNSPDGSDVQGDFRYGETHVAAVTFDGNETVAYLDGNKVWRHSDGKPAAVGASGVTIGQSPQGESGQAFDGSVAEARLYYTAFDNHELSSVTAVMDGN
jgi:hypothetical protein